MQSIALLKNENNLLPLNPTTITKVGVLGAHAKSGDDCSFGDYHAHPSHNISPLEGLQTLLGADKVVYVVFALIIE